ncbi:hypothetical protein [Leucobacter sp. PH1c]|uniref:hypothetical protein n=1 Tax=Leucobacter sp. PH1c TaxID=1397278 RepID=UPI0004692EC5|nr:hypothetical protein [Leucobacter sp. PH1c]
MVAWGERKMQAAQGAVRGRTIAEDYPVECEPGEHYRRKVPKPAYEEVQDEKAEAASLRTAGHETIVDAALASETDWLTHKREFDIQEVNLDPRDQGTADGRLSARNALSDAARSRLRSGPRMPTSRAARGW